MNLTLLILLLAFPIYHYPQISAVNPRFTTCNQAIQCGNLTNISYPFYDGKTRPEYCGYPGLKIDCENGSPQMNISNQAYNLLGISKTTIRVSLKSVNYTNACPDRLFNTTISSSLFNFSFVDQNLTFFYHCNDTHLLAGFMLKRECGHLGSALSTGYYATPSMLQRYNGPGLFSNCESVVIPILQSAAELIDTSRSLEQLLNAFAEGFELDLNAASTGFTCGLCVGSGGACGFNSSSSKFVCYCPDSNSTHTCVVEAVGLSPVSNHHGPAESTGGNSKIILFSAFSGSVAFILLVIVTILYWQRGNIQASKCLSRYNPNRNSCNVENVLKNYASLTPKRYTYSDIKKMTNSFAEKLGQGGFGAVYKGKLLDGRLVAVKLLKGSKGNGEEFSNEVASIGRTNHVNVVNLLGFCFKGNKRALVYEYMANGSLEKFVHREANDGHSLPLDTLFQVVLGIARGLEYLHRGCQTRILHFDIKPHNILLDEEFCPKISDFGLAKLIPHKKQSKVSMSGVRGTIGYIAPEVFCRHFGDVSHKSDVYSYGMMVLEVIGSRKRANGHQIERSSEQYFPECIYKQLEQGEEVEVDISVSDNDKETKRKMILVSLWCIQPVPSTRPSMSRVVQMLEGSLETIEVPSMPSYSSPPRSQWDPSTSSTMTT